MKMCGGVEVLFHAFLTLALFRGEWLASHPSCFTPREIAVGSHWTVGLVVLCFVPAPYK